ncbi:restriction endonuclease subunit S [Enterobacter sichuanensis]|uniref:restriction endonuclease subunit S n=1 Tax=Enterobacter sichuanensis TaxID=2071710 RepID=UPI0036D3E185
MSSEWSENYLSDLTDEITVGYVGSMTHEYADSGIPFLRSKNISNYEIVWDDIRYISSAFHNKIKKSVLHPGDVAVVRTGKPGTSCVIPNELSEGNCSDLVIIRVDKNKLCPHYLCYYLNSIAVHQIDSQIVGAVQQHFNVGSAKSLKIKSPSLLTQKRISFVLQCLDNKIKLNKVTNQTLEQIAQALFKSWFVDFEPVKAKISVLEAGGSQEDATLAAMTAISGKDDDALVVFEREHPEQYAELKATAELFPSAMQDSELGNIPVTWELGKLQDLLVLQRGFDLPSSARKDGEFPLIAASGPNGTHNVAMAKAPGVITGRSGVLGKVYLTLEDYWPLNTTLWVKEFKRATPCYAYELLRLLDMKAFNAGSAVPSLNRNHIHSLSYPLPPMALVNLFESSALLLHQRAHVNLKHSQSLALLRDTLLPKLLSGEITLPEAEQAVSEAENV